MATFAQQPGAPGRTARFVRQTLWSGELVRALDELRSRHPGASLEVSAIELALADVARALEAELSAAHGPGEGGVT